MNLDDMISRAKAEIEDAEAQLRAAQARLGELVTIRERLQRAEQRYAPGPGTAQAGASEQRAALPEPSAGIDLPQEGRPSLPEADPDVAQDDPEPDDPEAAQPEIAQTDRVIAALGGFSRSTTALQIRDRLAADGHELTTEQVRSALGYLKRKGRVLSPRHGLWRLPRPTAPRKGVPSASTTAPIKSFGPAASTTGPDEAGENGTSSQADVLTGAGLNSHPARQAPF